MSASVGVSPEEATIAAYRSSLARRAMVSYSAQSRAMLWALRPLLGDGEGGGLVGAGVGQDVPQHVGRRELLGWFVGGGDVGVVHGVDIQAVALSPRVAITYSGSRSVVAETNAWAVSTVRPWARWAVVA